MVKSAYQPDGPSGMRLSPIFRYHEATRSISTAAGCDASPLQGYP